MPRPMYSYSPVFSFRRASALIAGMRPVRNAYRFCAWVNWAADGATPVAACNDAVVMTLEAGSFVRRPNVTRGTSDEFFSHTL